MAREGSFTLIETVIALAIIAFVIVGVATVQGNSVAFSDYGRNITQATWLARRVLAQVEYLSQSHSFKDLETNVVEQKFEDRPDYAYSLEIKEWKFPFVQLLESAMGGDKDKDKDKDAGNDKAADKAAGADAGMSQMLEGVVKQVFGDEPIFMTAHVEVSWAEGAQRNSTGITYLLTNQAKLDEFIPTLKAAYDKATKPPPHQATGRQPPTGTPGQPGVPGAPPNGNPTQPPVTPPPPGTAGGD